MKRPKRSVLIRNISGINYGKDNKHWKNEKFGIKMDDICLQNWLDLENNKFKINESLNEMYFMKMEVYL